MCSERVSEPPGYWHDHACPRKAKWLVKSPTSVEPRPVCTQHRKWFDRWGEVVGPIPSEVQP